MSKADINRPSFARGRRTVRLFGERLSFVTDQKIIGFSALLAFFSIVIAAVSLTKGTYPISGADVLRTFVGKLETNHREMIQMIVLEWRLPRVVLAFFLGAALGMSGAIFQSLTRNPLGSPDVIGFSAGSYTGALLVILLFSGGYYETALGALIGGIATAAAVYLLAWRNGVQGFRLIIVGIGVAAMLGAFNAWMIRAADLQVPMSAAIWGAGSLNGLGFEQLLPVLLTLAVTMPATLGLSRPLRQLEMGDDIAHASGVEADRARLLLILLGVALTAIVTAAAGPIAFIALAAPQITRRLLASADAAMISSALMGGFLLLIADWTAQHAFAVQLPVGVMTVSIGGLYFLWLLFREGRK